MGECRETLVDQGLKFERRAHSRGYTYFLANHGNAAVEGWVPLQRGTKAAAIFNPLTAQAGRAPLRITAAGATEVYLRLAPLESVVVKSFNDSLSGADYAYWSAAGNAQPVAGTWSVAFTAGGPTLPAAQELKDLKSWTDLDGDAFKAFSGTATYKVSFAKPAGQAAAFKLALGQVAESARVKLNGRELGVLFTAPFEVTIPADQLSAQNTLEIAVTNLGANRIADLDRKDPSWKKFYNTNMPARIAANRGADGNFSAAKWTPRASGLIGPVTLTPVARLVPAQ